MKHAYQKRLHQKAVQQALKVYDYYLAHKDADSQTEIAQHFGHNNREWLRQQIIRAEAYYKDHPKERS